MTETTETVLYRVDLPAGWRFYEVQGRTVWRITDKDGKPTGKLAAFLIAPCYGKVWQAPVYFNADEDATEKRVTEIVQRAVRGMYDALQKEAIEQGREALSGCIRGGVRYKRHRWSNQGNCFGCGKMRKGSEVAKGEQIHG